MNDFIQRHALSFGITFVATFLTMVGAQLAQHVDGSITTDFLVALVFGAGRSALKVALESLGVKS